MRNIINITLYWLILLLVQQTNAQILYNLGGTSIDGGDGIAIDKSGNIIIAGHFSETVDFDPGPYVHNLSSNGSIDNFVVKYNPQGYYQWAISFGSATTDALNGVKTDANGNIYFCGSFSGQTDFDPGPGTVLRSPVGMIDAYVVKLDSNGNFIWVVPFGGDSLDEASDLDIDGNGDIIVTGYFQDTVEISPGGEKLIGGYGKNIFLIKFDSNSLYQWQFTWGNSLGAEGLAVISDTANNYYLGGYKTPAIIEPQSNFKKIFGGITINRDILLTKFSTDGLIQWTRNIGGPKDDIVTRKGIAIYQDCIYVIGVFSDTVDFDPSTSGTTQLISVGDYDVFVAKYDTVGNFVSCFGFGGTDQDKATDITVDNFNNIYLTGWFKGTVDFDPSGQIHNVTSQGTNGASDIFIAKYGTQGDLIWVNPYGAPVSGSTSLSFGSSIKLDLLGNFYVTGNFFSSCDFDPSPSTMMLSSLGSSDAFIVKYNSSGNVWKNIPEISISPNSLNFNNILAGSFKELGTLVYNYGDAALEITSVTTNNPTFVVVPHEATVLPFQYQQFVIRFSPTELGQQTGRILLLHNAAGGKDSISVTGIGTGLEATVSMPVSSGWNMISVPVLLLDNRPGTLFPNAISNAFEFTGSSYAIEDTLNMTNGYWIKFSSPDTLSFTGVACDSEAVNVKAGWNMIGGISFPVSTSTIVQDPPNNLKSKFYGYDIVYQEATTLIPGKGYWVKVLQDGKLILHSE